MLIEGKVYDVSEYMEDHPGGYDILIDSAKEGDSTEDFENAEHSRKAKREMEKHLIGQIA